MATKGGVSGMVRSGHPERASLARSVTRLDCPSRRLGIQRGTATTRHYFGRTGSSRPLGMQWHDGRGCRDDTDNVR